MPARYIVKAFVPAAKKGLLREIMGILEEREITFTVRMRRGRQYSPVCLRCNAPIDRGLRRRYHRECILEMLKEYLEEHGRPPLRDSHLGKIIKSYFNTTPYKLALQMEGIDERHDYHKVVKSTIHRIVEYEVKEERR